MKTPSQLLYFLFTALALSIVIASCQAVRGLKGSTKPSPASMFGLMLGWVVLTAIVAASGWTSRFDSFPPAVMPLIAASLVTSVVLCATRFGRQAVEHWSLAGMVGFQAFRLPLELVMHRAATEGVMPSQMSFSGQNFDILTGLLAIPLAAGLTTGHLGVKAASVWNLMGTLLLINIVSIAVLSVPGPLRAFHHQPANVWIGYFPFIWLPTFLVPLAAAGHVLIGRKLLLGKLK